MEKSVESISSFYDAIAPDYDNLMNDSDRRVREVVKKLFTQYVPGGNVLDFGGGTGLDIPWLTERDYSIFFLEPSDVMRTLAKKRSNPNQRLHVIEENIDFKTWTESHLPFGEKMDGAIMNFAVLNCIKDINVLFAKIAMVSDHGSYLVATILDSRLQGVFRRYSAVSAFRFLLSQRLSILNKYRGVYHETYIHSLRSIRKSVAPYFEIKSYIPVESSDFAVLILQRK
jgi:ubiquinone/menaquinone biosynthesis C-methylase UbiE